MKLLKNEWMLLIQIAKNLWKQYSGNTYAGDEHRKFPKQVIHESLERVEGGKD